MKINDVPNLRFHDFS
jgi:hypothetical protein